MENNLVREEIERRLRERENYFYDNDVPYGEWRLDREWVELQNQLASLERVNIAHEEKTDISLDDIQKQIADIDELIIKREEELEANNIPYGEWQLDSEYVTLLGQKQTLLNNLEVIKREYEAELDEVRSLLERKYQEFDDNNISYGEYQLDPEYVRLKSREDQLVSNLFDLDHTIDNKRDNTGNRNLFDTTSNRSTEQEEDKDKTPDIPSLGGNGSSSGDFGSNQSGTEQEEDKDKTPDIPSLDSDGSSSGDSGNNQSGTEQEEEDKDKTPDIPSLGGDGSSSGDSGNNQSDDVKDNDNEQPLKVTKNKAWQWVKDHKKQILIAVGLTAVAVSMVVIVNQLLPAMIAASKASQVSTLASSMVKNANLWHLSGVGEKAALHLASENSASLITSLTGKSALFNNVAGTWSIGGSSLQAFATEAASKAAIAASKVSSLSASALGFGLGGLATTGLGAIITNKSDKYKEYNNEIKEIKKRINDLDEESIVDIYPAIYVLISKLESDTSLSNSEKKILLEKANRILNKIKSIEEEKKERLEKEKEKEAERKENDGKENPEVGSDTEQEMEEDKDKTPDIPSLEENQEEKKDDIPDLSSSDKVSNNTGDEMDESTEARTFSEHSDQFDEALDLFYGRGRR